jgi:glycosyltransferase involved in cell wall biosynthesis
MAESVPVLSALVVIVRDEVRALLEWVAYHRVIGFDEIIVYDNESRDGTTELCQQLHNDGAITHRPWRDPPPESEIGPQIPAYEHAAANTSAEWLCFLDADEFLVLQDYKTVADLICVAGRYLMPIALNWKIFGSNGQTEYRDDLVIERFPRCGGPEQDVNRHIKTLGPASALQGGARVHVHGWVLAPGQHYVDALGNPVDVEECTFVTPPQWRGAWINHYIVKSREEFEQKQLRGKATHAVGDPTKYDRTVESYFTAYDRNEVEDGTIRSSTPRVKEMVGKLRNR